MGSPGPDNSLLFRPRGLIHGAEARALVESGEALVLAGGTCAFTSADVLCRRDAKTFQTRISAHRLMNWAKANGADRKLETLIRPRSPFAGIPLDSPRIMGILNVTPDSFFDGGQFAGPEDAIRRGAEIAREGADIIDVGGESTRPGSEPVPVEEEIRRVVPVIEGLTKKGIAVSVDTRNPETMLCARDAGAVAINDVSSLRHRPESAAVAASSGLAIVLMHMRGEPGTMQKKIHYHHAPLEVLTFLEEAVARAKSAGIPEERLLVDPGLGFGKRDSHNLAILDWLPTLFAIGCGILVGASRKSMIGRLGNAPKASERLPGSIAAGLFAASRGAQILRVHDVAETRQALNVWKALAEV